MIGRSQMSTIEEHGANRGHDAIMLRNQLREIETAIQRATQEIADRQSMLVEYREQRASIRRRLRSRKGG